jgi:hypothetical protein
MHGEKIGGLGGLTDLEEYLPVLWSTMSEYGYLVNPTIDNGV